ncbi:MAG: hypothetical protein KUG82_13025 [Pseudomonadales bacterium]|nr:hypothetical protein [Pseudomonadales bacterium]
MNKNYFFSTSLLLWTFATSLVYASNDNIIQIDRKNGEVHKEFIKLIEDQVAQLQDRSGRIALVGGSGIRNCTASLYISKQTTFVSLNINSLGYVDEFYIDHPSETFKTILFQNRITKNGSTAINVDHKDGGYTVKLENKTLVIQSRKQTSKSPACRFPFSRASYFNDESE